jgi:hypothetical protein
MKITNIHCAMWIFLPISTLGLDSKMAQIPISMVTQR